MKNQQEKIFYLVIVLEKNPKNERKKLNEHYEHLKLVITFKFNLQIFTFLQKQQKKKKKVEIFDYSALHLLYDAQGKT